MAGPTLAWPGYCSNICVPSSVVRRSGWQRCTPLSFEGLPLRRTTLFRGSFPFRQHNMLAGSEAAPPAPADVPVLRIVNSRERESSSGSDSDAPVIRSKTPSSWDCTNALAVTESVCIVVAAVSFTTSTLQSKQSSLVTSSSASDKKFLPKVGDISTWYGPALWVALLINVILRAFQRQASETTQKVWEQRNLKDFTLDQRMGKVEEDVKHFGIIARMLSRHLEKLGVRFREMRRSLRDSVQEAVLLTQKTSQVVSALAVREKKLEKELHETQQVLVAMQAQQAKQFDLLVAGMAKSARLHKLLEEEIVKHTSLRPLGALSSPSVIDSSKLSSKKGGAAAASRVQNGVQNLGLRKNLVEKDNCLKTENLYGKRRVVTVSGEGNQNNGQSIMDQNGRVMVTDVTVSKKKKSDYIPDTSFTKEDFWATTPAARPPTDYYVSTEIELETNSQDPFEVHESNSSMAQVDSFLSS